MSKGSTTQELISTVAHNLGELVVEKNKRYGDSALDPLRIFSKHVTKGQTQDAQSYNQILTRLDDKLKRIQNAELIRKNDVADVMGYLILLCVHQDWTDFEDLID